MKHLRSFGEMAVVAIHEGEKMRSKLDNRGKTCMFVGYADDHSGDVYRFLNVKTKRIIMSRDARWLNIMWKHYKRKHNYARRQMELFLDEEESLSLEGNEPVENRIEGDGNNTPTQRRLGLDIGIIGAREETLGRTRSQTQEMSSPTNESMERADITMEDWIQEICMISAETSGPTEPKTFQEAWHYPIEKERDDWRAAIRKEIRSMIERGVWRKTDRKKIPSNRRLIGDKWVFKIKRDGTYRARLVVLGYSQIPGVDYTDNFAPVAHNVSFRIALARMMVEKLDSLVMDVETAFLYGEIDKEIFMKSCLEWKKLIQDHQLLPTSERHIWSMPSSKTVLEKVCGYRKKGTLWIKMSPADPCMIFKENELGVCILIMYVDDMLIIRKMEQIQELATNRQKEFPVKMPHNLADYLGCEFHMNKVKTRGWLGQPSIIKSFEQNFGERAMKERLSLTPGTPRSTR